MLTIACGDDERIVTTQEVAAKLRGAAKAVQSGQCLAIDIRTGDVGGSRRSGLAVRYGGQRERDVTRSKMPELMRALDVSSQRSVVYSIGCALNAPYSSIGNRGKWWLWMVAGNFGGLIGDGDVIADGRCETEAECLRICEEQYNVFNRHYNSYVVERARTTDFAEKTTTTTGSTLLDVVYTDRHGDGNPHGSGVLRISKTTTRYVYVLARFQPSEGPPKQYRLDRGELEREGSVWSCAAGDRFYREPPAGNSLEAGEASELFSLPINFTQIQLDIAYREMASKTHPDAGGCKEDFKRVREEYDRLSIQVAV